MTVPHRRYPHRMATWSEFAADAPELAARVRAAFAVGKHCTMATIRADGGPRISGTEVEFADDGVFIGTDPVARKALDLRRDPRIAVHSPTRDPGLDGSWSGEAKITGAVVEVPTLDSYPPGAVRFRIDLSSAVFTGLSDDGSQLRIELWRPGRPTETMLRA